MSNKCELTIREASKLLDEGKISAVELTEACLERIKSKNSAINAFLTVCQDDAIGQAKETDRRIKDNQRRGTLDGIPVAIKDNMATLGVRTTAASHILENYISPYDATVVSKLKDAGAVILGKTNMDEFAMGSSTETSNFGPTRNPLDISRVPGGSSGGSAAAVADNMCIGAVGSDTGGSIRQPAAFCGIVGLKPTYGAVSRYGLLAMASSLDQIGPMTKTVEDAEEIFKIISGQDKKDSTSLKNYKIPASPAGRQISNDKQILNNKLQNIKIGIPKEYFISGLDENIKKNIMSATDMLEKSGAKIINISLPHTDYALATYYIIMPAEVSSNLARYDGIKYGLFEPGESLLEVYLKTRAKGLGAEAKRRIMLGTYVLSAGYYDAYYKKAQRVRTLVKNDFDQAWKKVDIILTPVTPTLPFKIGEKVNDPLEMYLSDIFTVPVNIAGLPAMAIPSGLVNNLPVAIQLIGKPFDEKTIFSVGKVYEKIRGI